MKCATRDCPNQDHEGLFEGAFCCACTHAMRTGKAGNGTAWIHRQAARLAEAENMNAAAEKIALRLAVASLLCASQADDPALWVLDPTITEAALQRALRDLHRAIEGTANREDVTP